MLSKKEQKYIQSLKIKKYRTREKRFVVEGAKNVQELLSSDFDVELVLATESFMAEHNLHTSDDYRVEEVSAKLLAQLGTFKTNDSCLAQVRQKTSQTFSEAITDHLFVLDGVGDPGNLGTIIRTLDWFGFKRLVCSRDCAEFYHPKTIASTMGSFTRIDVFYEDLVHLLEKVEAPILGADAAGSNIYQTKIQHGSVIVMGSESHGISPGVQQCIEQKIAIPRKGKSESLNVGIATGIIAGYLRNS